MAYIYKILNKVNGKFYIGSANDYKRRWYQHKRELKNNSHDNQYLQNAWNKYGESNFEWIVLQKDIDENVKYDIEQKYLDTLKPFPPIGYNISKIANGGFIGRDGNIILGEDISTSIYTNDQIIYAKKYISEGLKYKEITKVTGVKESTLSYIKHGRAWINIGNKYNDKIKELCDNKSKITKESAEELYTSGMSEKDIAKVFGVTDKRVKQLLEFYKAKIDGNAFICEHCKEEFIKSKFKRYGLIMYSGKQKYCKECAKRVNSKKTNSRKNIV